MSGPSNHPAASYPSWLVPALVPLTVLVGPPGNGARAWIDARRDDGDLVLDIAAIIEELAGVPSHRAGGEWIIPALQRRNDALAQLGRLPRRHDAAWLVSPSPLAWQRSFWTTRGATVQLLDPGKVAAILAARAEGIAEKWVHRWYSEAESAQAAPGPLPTGPRPSAAQRGYGPEHRVLRDKQLAREPWCRFCWEERQVKVRATVLDHIKAFKPGGVFDGKLWGDPKNHRSLCQDCHDARGATTRRPEKAPGAAADGRPMDPAHPWNRR